MNQPLRILLVTKSTGGVAEYIRQLVNGLDRDQFAITVACLSEGSPEFAAELAQVPNVKTFHVSMNRYQVDPFSDTRVLWALARHLRQERYDLVHAHASKPGFLTRLAALGTDTPVLYSPHCFAFHAGAGRVSATLVAALERLAARYLTTRIVTVADGERELAQQYGVGSNELFVTIHTGIEPDVYRLPVDKATLKASLNVPAQAVLVGAVGRLSQQKAPLDFVRMAAQVHQQRPEVHFVWIGSGPLTDAACRLSTELGLNGVLHFAGHRTDIPALLQCLDCFVLPSIWEGFPIALLEAMAAGTPVVATDILGTREAVVSGKSGLLAPVGDPAALAQAVFSILSDPLLAGRLARAAMEQIETVFTRERMLQAVSCLYRDLNAQRQLTDAVLLEQIAADVAPRLPEWFGADARLAGSPELRRYPHSFFLRFKVLTQAGESVLLAKIQRKPGMETIAPVLAVDLLREQARSEFEVEQVIWEAFAAEPEPDCLAIQPLAYLQRWNAILMPELTLRPLKAYLLRSQTVLQPEKTWRELEPFIRKAAHWLRVFHTRTGKLRPESFPRAALQAEIETQLDELHAFSAGQVSLSKLREGFEALLARLPNAVVPVASLHYDYQWSNVMVTPEGKICALDPRHLRREPVYADLATFLIDPVTRSVQIFSGGFFFPARQLARFREQFLEAYFGELPHDPQLLNLYCALAALHKWSMGERKMKKKGLKQILFKPALWLRRRYFSRVLEHYLSVAS